MQFNHPVGSFVKKYSSLVRPARTRQRPEILIAGPWMGEVGSEVQYWIPFLRKEKENGRFHGYTVWVVSRGGMGPAYEGVADRYIDIFDGIDVREYGVIREEGIRAIKGQKQIIRTEGENRLIRSIAQRNGIAEYDLFHPSEAWKLLIPWLEEKTSTNSILDSLHFQHVPADTAELERYADKLSLPDDFIAVKFYSNDLFQMSEANQSFVQSVIRMIAKKTHVVVLGHEEGIDEHRLFSIPSSRRIHIVPSSDRSTNLGNQLAVIAKSRGFVGTYGGFSLLPVILKKPSLSFYSDLLGEYRIHHYKHEAIANAMVEAVGNPPYLVSKTQNWSAINSFVTHT